MYRAVRSGQAGRDPGHPQVWCLFLVWGRRLAVRAKWVQGEVRVLAAQLPPVPAQLLGQMSSAAALKRVALPVIQVLSGLFP